MATVHDSPKPTADQIRSLYAKDYQYVDGTETVCVHLKSRKVNLTINDVVAKRIRANRSDLNSLGDDVQLQSNVVKFEVFNRTVDTDHETTRIKVLDVIEDSLGETYTVQSADRVDSQLKTIVLTIQNKPNAID